MLTSWDDDRTRDRDRDRDRWRTDDFTPSTSTSTNASTWPDTNYYPEQQPPSPFVPTNTLAMRNDTRDHNIIPSSQSMSSSYQHHHPHTSSMSFTSSMTFTHPTPSISQYPTSTFSNTSTSSSISISSQSQSYPTSTFLPSTSTSTSSQSQSYPSTFLPSTSTSTSTSSQSQSFPTSSFPSTSTFPSSTFSSTSMSPTTTARDLGQLLDLLSSSTTSTSTSTWSPSSTTHSHIQPTSTSHIHQQQQSRSQHLSSTYTSPLPMSHTPSLPSLSPSSSSSTSTSPMPVTDGEPTSKKRRSSTSTSTSTSKHSKSMISDDVPDSLARRLKHRAIDANRRVRLSAGFDALQAMVAPGESHSQIVLLEKSGEMLRSMQAEAASLKTTLRMLKRRRARREKGLSVKEEDEDEEIAMVKKESIGMGGRIVSDRPSAQFNVGHLNYFCDSNVMLSCTNLNGVLVDVNAALLRAFHLRAPEDRIGKFTLAPHTIQLATSSQPFGQHLAGLPITYTSHKTLHGPNPPISPSAIDPRTLSGLPSSNIVMRDGSVSAQPGLIKGATTNELVPYLPSVVSLQKLLRGELESCSIIFEGIDGRGQRYHARFTLWVIYNHQHIPQYIMAMCNPNSIIHFPHDSPPYYSTALRSIQGSSISLASSSSSSSNENSPCNNDFHA